MNLFSQTNDSASAADKPRKTDRRNEILVAAFEEFAAKGYADTRIEDVARRAEIAKGTIYLYFKNKELLFRAVLRSLIHNTFEEVEEFVRSFPGSADTLLHNILLRQYTELVKSSRFHSMLRLLIAESSRFPELSDIYLREIVQPGVAAIKLLIERGTASGEFRESRVIDFPQILIAPAVLAIVWQLTLGDRKKIDLDAYMKAHLELVLHGLRAPQSQNATSEVAIEKAGTQ
jgi:AcrR family transcriptional regulator